jgi:heme-degrading monooxygenase HmoA
MFLVLFEVHPSAEQKSHYLDIGKTLRPELVKVDGFIDNIRYGSLTKPGWVLSLSTWRDEKSLVRWRTQGLHHNAQEKGRKEVFLNYRLRICEVTADTHVPDGQKIQEQRLDITRAGDAEATVLISLNKTGLQDPTKEEALERLGLDLSNVEGLVSWDAFNAVLDPGDIIAYLSFTTANAAVDFLETRESQKDIRHRGARVIRDYGMYNRSEAPQFYEVERRE